MYYNFAVRTRKPITNNFITNRTLNGKTKYVDADRSDYAKYTSMLNAMPQHERMAMFRNQPWMIEALGRLRRTAELIIDIINRYFSPNRIPGTSSETDKEQEAT